MTEEPVGVRSEETGTDVSYRIPREIPRNSFDFRIAQLEQLSRIRYETVYALGEKRALELRPLAIAHAQEAELSEREIEGIGRLFDRLDGFERNLDDVLGLARRDFLASHPGMEETGLSDNAEYNSFLAKYIFRDLFEKEPEGELRVFLIRKYGVCFVYDNENDFPQFRNTREGVAIAAGHLKRLNLAGFEDDWDSSRMSRYPVLIFQTLRIPQDLDEAEKLLDAHRLLDHEFDHSVRDIIKDEFRNEDFVSKVGTKRLTQRYAGDIWG